MQHTVHDTGTADGGKAAAHKTRPLGDCGNALHC